MSSNPSTPIVPRQRFQARWETILQDMDLETFREEVAGMSDDLDPDAALVQLQTLDPSKALFLLSQLDPDLNLEHPEDEDPVELAKQVANLLSPQG